MNNSIEHNPQEVINQAIHELINTEGMKKQHARLTLMRMDGLAIPILIETMSSPIHQLRLEAAKLLGQMGDPEAIHVLIDALEDPEVDVRWAAMNSLILLDCASVGPLLKALTECFGSVWLREGAHHVLNELKRRNRLNDAELRVLNSLKEAAPEVEVPWAAEAALGQHKK